MSFQGMFLGRWAVALHLCLRFARNLPVMGPPGSRQFMAAHAAGSLYLKACPES